VQGPVEPVSVVNVTSTHLSGFPVQYPASIDLSAMDTDISNTFSVLAMSVLAVFLAHVFLAGV
jgi:hypothetical protein